MLCSLANRCWWIVLIATLFGCNSDFPKEESAYGYSLPIDDQKEIWNRFELPDRTQDEIRLNQIVFSARDEHNHVTKFEQQGIWAIDSATQKAVWHTPFPVEQYTSIVDPNDHSIVTSYSLLGVRQKLFCAYLHIIPPLKPTEKKGSAAWTEIWKYVILDIKTGEIVHQGNMSEPKQVEQFVFLGQTWFVINQREKTLTRYDPETGEKMWTLPNREHLKISLLADGKLTMVGTNEANTLQVKAIDIESGTVAYEDQLANLPFQKVFDALHRDNVLYVELGLQYARDFNLGPSYYRYTVAFDGITKKPMWRTSLK